MKTHEISDKRLYYIEYSAGDQKMYIEAGGLETVLGIVVERVKSLFPDKNRTEILDSINKIEILSYSSLYKEKKK